MKNLILSLLLFPVLAVGTPRAHAFPHFHAHHAKTTKTAHHDHHVFFVSKGGAPRFTGLKRDHAKFKAFKGRHTVTSPVASVAVPGVFDLTKKVSPPLDQGQCGDCWNFSIFKSYWSENLLNGVASMPQPAANYLLNNCSGVSAAQEYGCNGGDFPAGEGEEAPAVGTWAESLDPYTATDGSCKQGLPSLGLALSWNVVGDGTTPPTFQQLAQANYNSGLGHVLSVDVDASSGSWGDYQGGIYSDNGGCSIDHMIDMVGYNCETSIDTSGNCTFNAQGQPTNGDGYLIVENNWGTTGWGEGGYMRTRWGMNCIAQTAMYFTVTAPTPPPTPPTPTPPPTPPTPPPTPPTPPIPTSSGLPTWLEFLIVVLIAGVAFEVGRLTEKK